MRSTRSERDRSVAALAPGLLREAGFVGMEQMEIALLAGLVTGDPVLLIGEHGSAKTALVSRLASLLDLRFWAYDASKALFEDLIGFPDPFSLQRGVVEYAPTPLSIWDKEFVLVDELSRAAPPMQNKWLELLRSRQVMGRKVTGLQHVLAAMNPPGYLGTQPLDAALLGRFAWILDVPAASNMELEDVITVAGTITTDDAPLVSDMLRDGERPHPDLVSLLDAARRALPSIVAAQGTSAATYAAHLAIQLAGCAVRLDGRRLGMLRRNALSALAVVKARHGEQCAVLRSGTELHERFIEAVTLQSLPFAALDEGVERTTIVAAHHAAYGAAYAARGSARGRGDVATIIAALDPAVLVERYQAARPTLGRTDQHRVLSHVLEAVAAVPVSKRANPVTALLRLTALLGLDAADGTTDVDVVGRALAATWDCAGYGSVSIADAFRCVEQVELADLNQAPDGLAARIALSALMDEAGDVDEDELSRSCELLRRGLRALICAPEPEDLEEVA